MSSLVSDIIYTGSGTYTSPVVTVTLLNKEETPMEKNWIVYSPSYGTLSHGHKTEEAAWEAAKKSAASTKKSDIQVYVALGYVKQPIPEFETVKFN